MQPEPYASLDLDLDVSQDEDGTYIAQVRQWPGCIASGHTFAELVENVEETVAGYAVALGLPRPRRVETDAQPEASDVAPVVPFVRPQARVRPEAMQNDHMRVVVEDGPTLQQA
jgi:predicted RNase H-like HicB family nuclease